MKFLSNDTVMLFTDSETSIAQGGPSKFDNHKKRVLLVDDLLATGGTMKAACDLVRAIGGVVAGCAFAVELCFLKGRAQLQGAPVHVVMKID